MWWWTWIYNNTCRLPQNLWYWLRERLFISDRQVHLCKRTSFCLYKTWDISYFISWCWNAWNHRYWARQKNPYARWQKCPYRICQPLSWIYAGPGFLLSLKATQLQRFLHNNKKTNQIHRGLCYTQDNNSYKYTPKNHCKSGLHYLYRSN